MTIYSLAVLLFLFGTSLLFHVHFELFYSSNLSLFLLLSARLFVTILFTIIPPALSMCFLCFSLFLPAAAAAKSLQSCPTLCDPIDGSPPGSPVPGILQARTLEWVAISSSSAWKWKVKGKSLSCIRLFTTPWTAAFQAPPSMGFARQGYWSGVPSPSPLFLPTMCQCRRCKRLGLSPWVQKIPWRRKWQPDPLFLPGKFHRQRSLVGYSPWRFQELDMTEQRIKLQNPCPHWANILVERDGQ